MFEHIAHSASEGSASIGGAWAGYGKRFFGDRAIRPQLPADLHELEARAAETLGSGPYAYVAGSAGAAATERANREAFDRRPLAPRMLSGTGEPDLRTEVLGRQLEAPVLAGPVGVQSILHPEGERATAAACADVGVPMVMSTMSSTSIEDVGASSGDGPRWFQLYWPNDDLLAQSFLRRAKASGFEVLVVTVDTASLGWRPSVLDRGYLPMHGGVGIEVFLSDPVFRRSLERPPEVDLPRAVQAWDAQLGCAPRRWADLERLREWWDGPILLKGIVRADDARRAVHSGMDGVIVSNHGGRQVDGAVGALDALPHVVAEVGQEATVLFDSGIRGGADILKAVALGAEAVLVGRPYAYGLALDGAAGVEHVLRTLIADLAVSADLCGVRRVADADETLFGGAQ